jgi:hypothetical protein
MGASKKERNVEGYGGRWKAVKWRQNDLEFRNKWKREINRKCKQFSPPNNATELNGQYRLA